ncbi:hypothetical protein HLH33_09835 [Gluconacetobacter diazotrophicus]|uniref:Uncharacterized protein n=1 Tax=Gluconacetobacter diazotrophicus TaxID=33996 RepID=A0A7W4I547_GLUDI|nr:hypothetical protein [Gluconacetobacter diazotrophicus]MBB2156604.1 hypothetical protein [Gluconacetobacter diazotrophicus]
MPALSLPQPPDERSSNFELLAMTKLNQIMVVLAEIHQLVSPPETQDGPSIVEVLLQLSEQITVQSEQMARLTAAVEQRFPADAPGLTAP